MTDRLGLLAANSIFFLATIPNACAWHYSAGRLRQQQQELLFKIIRENAETAFGKAHGFGAMRTVDDFRARVPVAEYDDMVPWIERVASGEKHVLTRAPVRLFEPTSGSSAASKLIPYTNSLSADFRRGIDPWICALYLANPGLLRGSAYWSITPAFAQDTKTHGGIRIGFGDDGEYLNPLQRLVMETISAVPSEVKSIRTLESFRYVTLLFLAARKNLRLISVWNPSFITLLISDLGRCLGRIAANIDTGSVPALPGLDEKVRRSLEKKFQARPSRASVLAAIAAETREGNGVTLAERVWPELSLISCWTGGNAEDHVQEVRRTFPRARIQPKGILATEACISFPLGNADAVLSHRSHFFEFQSVGPFGMPSKKNSEFLADELLPGNRYQVIVTTSGGLYRYLLGDIIECTGGYRSIPRLRFIGRGTKIVDLVGEKMNEFFLTGVVEHALQRFGVKPAFWMIAPQKSAAAVARYVLFIEPDAGDNTRISQLVACIEKALRESYHYDYARRLGQLGSLAAFILNRSDKPAHEVYSETCFRLFGQELGGVKSTRLHRYQGWSDEFSGNFIE